MIMMKLKSAKGKKFLFFVYSLVFTILLAIPLGIYFLGGDE
ncbi:DUF2534 family protein [Salmonella enterica]|nr:DUF2534 family protein [Salmonella enterica]